MRVIGIGEPAVAPDLTSLPRQQPDAPHPAHREGEEAPEVVEAAGVLVGDAHAVPRRHELLVYPQHTLVAQHPRVVGVGEAVVGAGRRVEEHGRLRLVGTPSVRARCRQLPSEPAVHGGVGQPCVVEVVDSVVDVVAVRHPHRVRSCSWIAVV